MTFQFIRFPTLVVALLIALNVGAAPAISNGQPSAIPRVTTFLLSSGADFALGSGVLSIEAQEQTEKVIDQFKAQRIDFIAVTSFANTSALKQRSVLALERGRSIKAFFTLHGVNPQSITIRVGDESIVDEGRTGQVLFGVGVGG